MILEEAQLKRWANGTVGICNAGDFADEFHDGEGPSRAELGAELGEEKADGLYNQARG